MTPNQKEVHTILAQYGPLPDVALVPLVQHLGRNHQSSSGIRTRRAELERMRYVAPTGKTITTPSGRHALMFEVVR